MLFSRSYYLDRKQKKPVPICFYLLSCAQQQLPGMSILIYSPNNLLESVYLSHLQQSTTSTHRYTRTAQHQTALQETKQEKILAVNTVLASIKRNRPLLFCFMPILYCTYGLCVLPLSPLSLILPLVGWPDIPSSKNNLFLHSYMHNTLCFDLSTFALPPLPPPPSFPDK